MGETDREFGEIQTKLAHFEDYRKSTEQDITDFREAITGVKMDFIRADGATKGILSQLIKLNKNHVEQLKKMSVKVEDCDLCLTAHQTSLEDFERLLDELSTKLDSTVSEVSKLQKLRYQLLAVLVAIPILMKIVSLVRGIKP